MSDMTDVLAKWMYESETSDDWEDCPESARRVWRHNAKATIDFLSAAGFGPVQETRAEAWDECESASYEIRLDPTGKFWEPYKVNPYREDT